MIGAWVAVGVMAGIICREMVPRRPPEVPRETDFIQIENQAQKVAEIVERIQVLNRLIVDIELCDPGEMHRNFRTVWESGGKNRNYDFWVDGIDGTTADMLILAKRERARLRASLLTEVDVLTRLRCTQND